MTDILKPGDLCFLTRLTEHEALTGRVVTIISGPTPDAEGDLYMVAAPWTMELFQGRDCVALRRNLMRITPPILPAAKRRTPETTD